MSVELSKFKKKKKKKSTPPKPTIAAGVQSREEEKSIEPSALSQPAVIPPDIHAQGGPDINMAAASAVARQRQQGPPNNGPPPDQAHAILSNLSNKEGNAIPEGMNYMEEQHIKYGNDMGNYKPQPIIGTEHMATVYKGGETMTPDEYAYFFNWQHPLIPGGKQFARNKPKGVSHLYDETHLHYNVLAEKDRKFEFSRVHGGLVQNRTRWDECPYFLSSY